MRMQREKLSEVLPSDELFEQLEFGTVDINLVEKNDGYYVPMSEGVTISI